jgi:hypothetical protein
MAEQLHLRTLHFGNEAGKPARSVERGTSDSAVECNISKEGAQRYRVSSLGCPGRQQGLARGRNGGSHRGKNKAKISLTWRRKSEILLGLFEVGYVFLSLPIGAG